MDGRIKDNLYFGVRSVAINIFGKLGGTSEVC